MSALIAWAIEALVASALLMAAVLMLRAPVRRAFGPQVAYALWLLPAARLALPPLPGDWGFTRFIAPAVDRSLEHGVVMGLMEAHRLPAAVARHAIARVELGVAHAGTIDMAVVPPVTVAAGAPLGLLLVGLWVAGVIAFVGWQVIAHALFCHRLRRRARRRTPIAGARIEMIVSDAAAGPLAFGIWRKHVAFPSDFADRYDEDEQALALAHEMTHHARGDLIANWVALVVLGLHWFNPLAWRAFRAFRADQEMACDAQVISGRGRALRHAYGRAILKAAHGGAVSAACHLHTVDEIKGRLRMLTNNAPSRLRAAFGLGAVAGIAGFGLVLTASGTLAAERLGAHHAARSVVAAAGLTAPLPPVPLRRAEPGSRAVPPVPPAPPVPGTVQAPAAPVPPEAPLAPASSAAPEAPVPSVPPVPPIAINAPQVIEGNCGSEANEILTNDTVNGRQRITICKDRIERIAANAEAMRINAAAIKRQVCRETLNGLRSARSALAAQRRAINVDEQLATIDDEIANMERELAQLR